MALWPCENPSCNSRGVPHPNCLCPPPAEPMKEGGMVNAGGMSQAQVDHYCKGDWPHEKNCEYYAEGGQVLQSPTGNIYEPESPQEAAQLVGQGYTPPNPEDLAQYQKEQKFGTTEQKVQTAAEGAGDVLTFGAFPYLEQKLLGLSPEAIRARREVNPGTRALGEIAALPLSPVTEIAGAVGAALPEATTAVGRVAHASLENAIASGLLSAGDETSRMLTNDPNQSASSALAHVGLSALLGGGFGALARLPAEGWETLPEKAKGVATGFVQRMGEHLGGPLEAEVEAVKQGIIKGPFPNFPPEPGTPLLEQSESSLLNRIRSVEAPKMAGEDFGRNLADKFVSDTLPESLARSLGFGAGKLTGIPGAEWLGQFVGKRTLEPLIKSVLPGLVRPIGRFLPSTDGLVGAMRYGLNSEAGRGLIGDSVHALLNGAKIELPNLSAEQLLGLDDKVKQAGADPSRLLNISNNIQHYLPEHAQAGAKQVAQAVNYINNNRPSSSKPAPLDTEQPPSLAQEVRHKSLLNLAEQPLNILKKVQDGSLKSQDIKDLNGMYPELYSALRARIQEEMIPVLSKGKSIPYAMRQSMSMFLGQPLDTTMIPSSIQKIQAVFGARQQSQQPAPAVKTKKGTSKLGKMASDSRTPEQARELEKASQPG